MWYIETKTKREILCCFITFPRCFVAKVLSIQNTVVKEDATYIVVKGG